MKNYKLGVLLCLSLFPFLFGCQRHYLSICQQKINREYLASTYVQTPDPRQKNPPVGQMLTLSWQIPGKLLKYAPEIKLYVIYWNHTEQVLHFPITQRLGYVNYQLLNEEFQEKKGILTYRAEIVTADGEIYTEWKHQLWVNLIDVKDEEISSSAQSTSSSVNSQSMQGSVSETP